MTNILGDQSDIDLLRNALIGRSVVSVEMFDGRQGPLIDDSSYYYRKTAEGRVVLDDGTELLLVGNEGGCGCGAGDYYLTKLNDIALNGITDVQITTDTSQLDPRYGEGPQTYSIFVLAFGQDNPVELATFDGSDGNGYYGTGFQFRIVVPDND